MKDIKNYETPEFDVTIYEVEDILTASGNPGDLEIDKDDPNGDEGWFG